MTQTLEQRIRQGQEQHRLWIEEDALPYPLLHSWCDATLELNYEQFTQGEMNRRLISWISTHDGCYHKYCVAEEQA